MNSRILFSAVLALCAAVPGTAAAALPAGALDPTFGGGAFALDLRPGDDDQITDQAAMADGRVVALTERGDVLRLRADGTLDPSFAGDGVTTAPLGPGGEATGLDVDAGGRVWLAGATVVGGNYQPAVGRLTAAGEPDTTFDDDGWMKANFSDAGTYGWGSDVMPLPGGGAVLGGGQWLTDGGVDLGVLQVTDAGRLDTTFSDDGRVSASIGFNDYPAAAVRDAQGRISVLGTVNSSSESNRAGILRVDASGALDRSFGGDGTVAAALPTTEHVGARSLAADAGGRLVLGVVVDETPAVARLTPTGDVDTSFDGDGLRIAGPRLGAAGIDVAADGKVLLAGARPTSATTSTAEVTRLDEHGRPDPSFGDGGSRSFAFDAAPGQVATGVVAQPDGRILVAGYAYTPAPQSGGGDNRGRFDDEPVLDLGFARLLGAATQDPVVDGVPLPPAPPTPSVPSPPATPRTAPAPPRGKPTPPRIATVGASRFSGTAPAGAKVDVAVVRRTGKRCRTLAAKHVRFRTVPCSKPAWLRASGSARWSLKLRGRLPKGRYELLVRVGGTGKATVRKAFRVR
jgi:uncharacterized delta-60 repeat protein